MMTKLLIHFHLYYLDQLDYFLEKLSNIEGCTYELYVTMVEKNAEAEQKILRLFPDARILLVPNKGYDVGPFIDVLNRVNLRDYDYVLKVHTKNTSLNNGDKINGKWISRKCWMPLLVESLIGSEKIFANNLLRFARHPETGMVASKYLITSSTDSYTNILPQVQNTIKKLSLNVPQKLTFVAGTMFMARAHLFCPIVKAGYTLNDFEPTGRTSQGNQLAHVFERVFGAMITGQQHSIYKNNKGTCKTKFTYIFNRIKHFIVYTKKIDKNTKIIKLFGITVVKYSPVATCHSFIKGLFYKKKGNTKKYKFLGITILKKTKMPYKKIYKILGIRFSKSRYVKLTFADNLQKCSKRFSTQTKFNRLAVFASFNKDGLILDYVVYYLTELKKVVDGIIFVTDNPILPSELEKIKDLVVYAQCERHEEYDFGSYKRGFFWAKKNRLLDGCEELVLCNDSCYGPFYPFTEMFDTMAKRTCDFWGMTKNIEISEHIQSYFLLFKKQIFNSQSFISFFKNIKKQNDVSEVIIKYEIGLSKFLFSHGYTADCYISYQYNSKVYPYAFHKNITVFPVFLLKNRAPLIKVKAIQKNDCNLDGAYKLVKYIPPAVLNIIGKQTAFVNNISFSLIMPTYNRKNLLQKSIDSVLRQSYQNFELIIIDDGSSDDTENFIRQFYANELQNSKIIYIKKQNEGVCKARNAGLKAAKNDWIGYVDSDNLVYPNYLETFVYAISQNDNKTYYSKYERMSDRKKIGCPFNFQKLLKGNYIDLGTFVHHKSVYLELGGFDENMTRLVDWDLILTYTNKYQPKFINLQTLLYNDLDDHERISNSANYEKNFVYIKKKHLLSVTTIITTYNHEKYIAKAIDSAIRQKGNFAHEILISDDASTDKTPQIIEKYTKKYPNLIKNISSLKNLGISENMKKCFCHATGKYIAILEGDDYWTDKYKLEKQTRFLEENPDCSMVFNKINILNQKTGKIYQLSRQDNLPNKLTGNNFLANTHLNLIANFSSCLFIGNYIKSLPVQLYDFRFNEIALAFYLDTKGKIGFIDEPLSVYRQHFDSVWTGADPKKQLEEAIKVRKMAYKVCAEKYKERIKKIINDKNTELNKYTN